MKLLFLIILLANIFVLLWEYRYGTTFAPTQSPVILEQNTPGLEPIRLVNELPAASGKNQSVAPVNKPDAETTMQTKNPTPNQP